MAESLRFDGRVAAITGAGRGLGRQYALLLAERGAKVVVNDIIGKDGADPAAALVTEIRAAGGDAVANHDDVSAPDSGESIVQDAVEAFGRIDIVITNAGIAYKEHPFVETTHEGLMRMMAIHFGGTFSLVHAAWKRFVEEGYGRIVTVTSAAGMYGQPGAVEYSAAKGAIYGFSRALAQETAATSDIKLNILSPAGVAGTNDDLDVDAETKAFMARFLDAALVAPGVAYLAHESCPFNGRTFTVGGGHMGRIVVGETEGHWPEEPTLEAFAATPDEIDDPEGITIHEDAVSWGSWLAELGSAKTSRS